MYFLGIDIGTTSTKALLLSDQLEIAAEGSASYPMRVLGGGAVEQSPEDWWLACRAVLHRFWSEGFDPKRVGCVAVSGHGVSLVVTDCSGQVLRPAISSLDTRCRKQTEEIRRAAGERILRINGNRVGAFNFEPKLKWLKETEPAHYRAMPCFLSATGYVNYRLTGRRCLNVSDGGIGMAFDRCGSSGWSREIIAAMGLDEEKFPELRDSSEVIGTVHVRAAEETGLPAGTPVLAGGEDTSSAALAMGVTKPGCAFLSLGTQGTVGVCADRYAVRPEILGFPHVLPGLHLLSGSMSSFGAGLQWFVREWCRDLAERAARTDPPGGVHALLAEACARTQAGSRDLLFLPYLSGELHPILDENAAGVFFGLTLEHTREDMARAVMEGAAHAIRHNLHYAEQVAGPIGELRATGGPARSAIWCQAIADITGRPVKVAGARGGAGGAPLGNALLAAGRLTGQPLEAMLAACCTVEREYEPAEAARGVYDRHHDVYRRLYPQLRELFPLLKGITPPGKEVI